jgi:hypothetical protein
MQSINLNNGFIDWLTNAVKKPSKDKVAKAAHRAIPTHVPPPSLPSPPAPALVNDFIPMPEVATPVDEIPLPPIEVSPAVEMPSSEIANSVILNLDPFSLASADMTTEVTVSNSSLDLDIPSASIDNSFESIPLTDRAITVIPATSSGVTATLAQRILAKLTLSNFTYLLLVAAAVATVSYFIYQWKFSTKPQEDAPDDKTGQKGYDIQALVEDPKQVTEENTAVEETNIKKKEVVNPLKSKNISEQKVSNETIFKLFAFGLSALFAGGIFKYTMHTKEQNDQSNLLGLQAKESRNRSELLKQTAACFNKELNAFMKGAIQATEDQQQRELKELSASEQRQFNLIELQAKEYQKRSELLKQTAACFDKELNAFMKGAIQATEDQQQRELTELSASEQRLFNLIELQAKEYQKRSELLKQTAACFNKELNAFTKGAIQATEKQQLRELSDLSALEQRQFNVLELQAEESQKRSELLKQTAACFNKELNAFTKGAIQATEKQQQRELTELSASEQRQFNVLELQAKESQKRSGLQEQAASGINQRYAFIKGAIQATEKQQQRELTELSASEQRQFSVLQLQAKESQKRSELQEQAASGFNQQYAFTKGAIQATEKQQLRELSDLSALEQRQFNVLELQAEESQKRSGLQEQAASGINQRYAFIKGAIQATEKQQLRELSDLSALEQRQFNVLELQAKESQARSELFTQHAEHLSWAKKVMLLHESEPRGRENIAKEFLLQAQNKHQEHVNGVSQISLLQESITEKVSIRQSYIESLSEMIRSAITEQQNIENTEAVNEFRLPLDSVLVINKRAPSIVSNIAVSTTLSTRSGAASPDPFSPKQITSNKRLNGFNVMPPKHSSASQSGENSQASGSQTEDINSFERESSF